LLFFIHSPSLSGQLILFFSGIQTQSVEQLSRQKDMSTEDTVMRGADSLPESLVLPLCKKLNEAEGLIH
jgi:hypothetical protein